MAVEEKTGRPYFVMDLVLDADENPMTLEGFRKAGKVTETLAERWYDDLCAALDYCHAQSVVHRDVKLNNVLLDATGHAVLSDFGVSRIFDPEVRNDLQVTTTFVEGETTGMRPVMGTYWYLAPELRKGGEATAASDWYALGVTFFRLLTGLWYEPGTDALDLLTPFDRRWRDRLERLLSDDPAARIRQRVEKRRPRRFGRGIGIFLFGVGLVCAIVLTRHWVALFTGATMAKSSPRCGETHRCSHRFAARCRSADMHLRRGGVLASPDERGLSVPLCTNETVQVARISLAFDAANRFVFCLCPAGTNSYRNIAIAVTCPYWLAATPITRRQWFAVRGEPLKAWEGGEDAPMTYVTRDEVTNFCARDKVHHWGRTEWGATTIGLYAGQGLALTNPVERTGYLPLMVGTYLAPDIPGDRAWSADFDRLPHLGFRLCIGPKQGARDAFGLCYNTAHGEDRH